MSPRWTKRPRLHLAGREESQKTPNQENGKMQNDTEARALDRASQSPESWEVHSHRRGDSGFLGSYFVVVVVFLEVGWSRQSLKVPHA